MQLNNNQADIFVPNGEEIDDALKKTTSLCIAAHQDDCEIMAYHAIAECYNVSKKGFTSVIVTDGAGSPRNGLYEHYTNEEMKALPSLTST